MKRKSLAFTLAFSLVLSLQAQFITTHSNGMDHNFYSVESVESDIIMAGTVYPAGQLTGTDIHVQRMDQNGNVLWEMYHDIGTDERCIDMTLQGEDFILLTGSTIYDGHQRVFVMRLNQTDGSLIDMVHLFPDIYSNSPDQFGTDIVYDEVLDQYYIAGWADDDITTYAASQVSGPLTHEQVGLLICLDGNLNSVWTNEIRRLAGPITTAENSSLAVIPGKGICMSGNTFDLNGHITMYDPATGALIWGITPRLFGGLNGRLYSFGGLAYDKSKDRILCNLSRDSGGSGSFLAEISGASGSGATVTGLYEYTEAGTTDWMLLPRDIVLNPSQGLIYVTGVSVMVPQQYNLWSNMPGILVLDYNSLTALDYSYIENSSPNHFQHDHDYYTSGILRSKCSKDESTLWNGGLAYIGYDYSMSGGNNVYNLMIHQTDPLGNVEEPCQVHVEPATALIEHADMGRPYVFNLTHDVDPYTSSPYLISHDEETGCFEEEPCQMTVNSISISQAINCIEAEFTANVSAGSGTTPVNYIWDWGDGTTTVTYSPTATHFFAGFIASGCAYTVCVTVIGTGSDGNNCSDQACRSISIPFLPNFNGFQCPTCFTAPKRGDANEDAASTLNDVKVVPNPAQDQFVLQGLDGTASISIVDLFGRTVYAGSVMSQQAVDVSELSAGVYIVFATSADGSSFNERLVID